MANFIHAKCTLRVLASGASGVPNAKFLAFGTLNTKNPLTEDVLNVKCQMHLAFAMVPSYFWNHIWIDMLNFFIIFYKTSLSLSLSLCATPQSSHCCPPCHTVKVVAPSTMPHHQPLTCSELPPMDLSHMDGYAKSFWYLGTFGSISMNLPKFFFLFLFLFCMCVWFWVDFDGLWWANFGGLWRLWADYGGCATAEGGR